MIQTRCYGKKMFLKIRFKTVLVLIIVITLTVIYFTNSNITTLIEASEIPIILWWTPFILETKKLVRCEDRYQCVFTKNRSYTSHSNLAAYLFYGSSFDYADLPLPKTRIPWAIYHEESPKNLALFLHKDGQSVFDIAATFSRNSNFPVPLQYLKNIEQLTDNLYYAPLTLKNELLSTNAPILYVQSNCDTPSERDYIVREIMKYIKVDSFGTCLNNKKLPETYNIEKTLKDLYDYEFMYFVSQYKFVIAIENAICEDYITEKLWRPLMAGSIPIYLGSPSIKDWLPNKHSAILIQDHTSILSLVTEIHKLNTNDTLYEQYMRHKLSKSDKITNALLKSKLEKGSYGIENNLDFPIAAFECFLCKTVHEKDYLTEPAVYNCPKPYSRDRNEENWWRFHWDIGRCQAKTLKYFVDVLKYSNFTKEMFDIEFNKYYTKNDC